ncbi:MAG: MFS transporter [Burkholderiales bacterium]|nr:MFS transporter [Burkholderiales bacterium]
MLPTRPLLALITTLFVQALVSLTLAMPSVLAPAVAPSLGVGAERVGMFVGVAYLAAMLSGLHSGDWAARIGAVRLSQVALLCAAIGACTGALGIALAVLGAAVLIGTGYGLTNPSAASLLMRHAPVKRRGLFFSIKQGGVPIGVAIAGVLLPWGLATIGWQAAVLAIGGTCLLAAVLLTPLVRRLEPERGAAPAAARAAPANTASGGLLDVLRDPGLRRLSLASFSYAGTQICFLTFLVSYLNLELSQSLAAAAGVLASAQLVATVGRVVWGHSADRWFDPAALLAGLGLAMGVACALLALLDSSSSPVWILLVALVCAATAMAWNGVFFVELARHSGKHDMTRMAGATQVFTFGGGMVMPVVFGQMVRISGSYATAYLLLAALPTVAALAMWRSLGAEAAAAQAQAQAQAPK